MIDNEEQEIRAYLDTLEQWAEQVIATCPSDEYLEQIASWWFLAIAPDKAREYGIECWQRLGARALMVDINACFYRWKQLRKRFGSTQIGRVDDWYVSMGNVLRDMFGYCIMYCVMRGLRPDSIQWDSVWAQMPEEAIPPMNESLIVEVWDHDAHAGMELFALNMAYNCWRHAYALR